MPDWTTPRTAEVSDLLTAAWWNSEVRDNLLHIYQSVPIAITSVTDSHAGIVPTANQAVFWPFVCPAAGTISQISMVFGDTGNNVDVGVYAADGSRLKTSGSKAVTGTGLKTFDLTSPQVLTPFTLYYLAYAFDGSGTNPGGTGGPEIVIAKTVAAAFPLPAGPVTFGAAPTGVAAMCAILT